MSGETKSPFDERLKEIGTPVIPPGSSNPTEQQQDPTDMDIGDLLGLGDDDKQTFESPQIENPADKLSKLQDLLSNTKEQLESSARSKEREASRPPPVARHRVRQQRNHAEHAPGGSGRRSVDGRRSTSAALGCERERHGCRLSLAAKPPRSVRGARLVPVPGGLPVVGET